MPSRSSRSGVIAATPSSCECSRMPRRHSRELRRDLGGLNYQDLLLQAAALLRDKPKIREYFRQRFTHLLVDEFQDTDPIQAEVMLLLTADDPKQTDWHRCKPVPGSLFVVGDPKQSIYRFRRADIVTYSEVKRIIEQNGKLVALTTNFRSQKPVIDWVNETFEQILPGVADKYSPAHCSMIPGQAPGDKDGFGVEVLKVPEEYGKNPEVLAYEPEVISQVIHNAVAPNPDEATGEAWRLHDYRRTEEEPVHVRPEAVGAWHSLAGHGRSGAQRDSPVEPVVPVPRGGHRAGQPRRPRGVVAERAFRHQRHGTICLQGGRGKVLVPHEDSRGSPCRNCRTACRCLFAALLLRPVDEDVPARGCRGTDRGGPGTCRQRRRRTRWKYACRRSGSGDRAAAGCPIDRKLDLRTCRITCARWSMAPRTHDAVPAASPAEAPVRIMNLHQAKGLEAPVVFLADPTGAFSHEPQIHIDRSGGPVRGYLAIYGTSNGFHRPLLAYPEQWEGFAEEEGKFLKAEKDRLLYVAATRAGNRLVVTQREKANHWNPWSPLKGYLGGCEDMEVREVAAPPKTAAVTVGEGDPAQAANAIGERWQKTLARSYALVAAKAISVSGSVPGATAGEHGTEWGTVIHSLLEAAMRDSAADLHDLAYASLQHEGLDPARADEAIAVVRSVIDFGNLEACPGERSSAVGSAVPDVDARRRCSRRWRANRPARRNRFGVPRAERLGHRRLQDRCASSKPCSRSRRALPWSSGTLRQGVARNDRRERGGKRAILHACRCLFAGVVRHNLRGTPGVLPWFSGLAKL